MVKAASKLSMFWLRENKSFQSIGSTIQPITNTASVQIFASGSKIQSLGLDMQKPTKETFCRKRSRWRPVSIGVFILPYHFVFACHQNYNIQACHFGLQPLFHRFIVCEMKALPNFIMTVRGLGMYVLRFSAFLYCSF